MTSVSRHYDVLKHRRRQCRRYHQNFLLFNNYQITACIADLFNSFAKKCMWLHFAR